MGGTRLLKRLCGACGLLVVGGGRGCVTGGTIKKINVIRRSRK